MIKKKGQIVPRCLVTCGEPKSRHLVKFGADVRIEGRKITLLTPGYAIEIPLLTHVHKKKRQRTVKGFCFYNLAICYGFIDTHLFKEGGYGGSSGLSISYMRPPLDVQEAFDSSYVDNRFFLI